ncbi:hypothetical protein TRICI_004032 [Trichomonascus ciferrii]|uniref:Transferase n=1 Tax=Trichomonascus ciferrii TaxID=44093 RepID=A0A642V1H5_9ASCO|nr:hypothetical protein TRICI_004032 [Trichomonascus ciferrii]
MGQVEVIERHVLTCADEDKIAALESPYKFGALEDLVFPFVPVENVFVYPQSADQELVSVDRLKQALSSVLNYYPHLTGRLQFDEQTKSPEINRLDTGCELHVAKCSARINDLVSHKSGRLLVTDLPGSGADLTPPFDPSLEGVCRDPILAVQHTRFACGGVTLGVRTHHIAADACSIFQFSRDLAEMYRNIATGAHETTLSNPPVIRSYLQGSVSALSEEERSKALQYNPPGLYVDDTPPIEIPEESAESTKPSVVGHVLRFTSDELKEIKQTATDPEGNNWVSTFEALSAYLAQKVYQARVELLESEGKIASEHLSSGVFSALNVRDLDRLNLPPAYFPNAFYAVNTAIPHETYTNGPLWKVAKAIHTAIRSIDQDTIKQTVDWVAAQPDKSRIRFKNFTLAEGNTTLTQWSRYNMYIDMYFDHDRNGTPIHPILSTPPFTVTTRIEGLAIFIATEKQLSKTEYPPSLDVLLSLSNPLWNTSSLKHIADKL